MAFFAKDEMEPKTRLFVPDALVSGATTALSQPQAHQLRTVHRLAEGATVALFNGRDGEFLAALVFDKRTVSARIGDQRRFQSKPADLWLLFAPVKHGRIDFLVEKASELGVAELYPVITSRTQMSRVNIGRLAETAREAAEQCERLTVPPVHEAQALSKLLQQWDARRTLFVCAEAGEAKPAAQAFAARKGPAALLVGPEGGFAPEELAVLAELPFVVPVGLGPRLLRAETAALAALSCWQAVVGEWSDETARPRKDIMD